jgi:hypothetical protein
MAFRFTEAHSFYAERLQELFDIYYAMAAGEEVNSLHSPKTLELPKHYDSETDDVIIRSVWQESGINKLIDIIEKKHISIISRQTYNDKQHMETNNEIVHRLRNILYDIFVVMPLTAMINYNYLSCNDFNIISDENDNSIYQSYMDPKKLYIEYSTLWMAKIKKIAADLAIFTKNNYSMIIKFNSYEIAQNYNSNTKIKLKFNEFDRE